MALVLCAVLVAPRRLRPTVAALGTVFAVGVGFSLLLLAWHLPSDVFGGYLVAALWAALAVAAVSACEVRRPSRSPHPRVPRASTRPEAGEEMLIPVLVAGAVALTMLTAVLLRPRQVELFAADNHSLVAAGLGIAMLAVLISSVLTAALRR